MNCQTARQLVYCLFLGLIPAFSLADVDIEGDLETQVWTPEEGIYHIIGDATVLQDNTLFIKPGTVIEGDPETILWVYGQVIAEGSEELPIIFTYTQDGTFWDGLRIVETDDVSHFRWCTFEYCYTYHAHIHGGAINLSGATAFFDHCTFQHNASEENSSAIYSNHSNATITNSIFRWNDAGGSGAVGCDVGGTLSISYCLFYENIADAAPVGNFYPCDVTLDHLTIANNTSRLLFYSDVFFSRVSVQLTNSIAGLLTYAQLFLQHWGLEVE